MAYLFLKCLRDVKLFWKILAFKLKVIDVSFTSQSLLLMDLQCLVARVWL